MNMINILIVAIMEKIAIRLNIADIKLPNLSMMRHVLHYISKIDTENIETSFTFLINVYP